MTSTQIEPGRVERSHTEIRRIHSLGGSEFEHSREQEKYNDIDAYGVGGITANQAPNINTDTLYRLLYVLAPTAYLVLWKPNPNQHLEQDLEQFDLLALWASNSGTRSVVIGHELIPTA